jgi:hypothetical protein
MEPEQCVGVDMPRGAVDDRPRSVPRLLTAEPIAAVMVLADGAP